MLVSVAPQKFAFGVEGDSDDWTIRPGEPGNSRRMKRQGPEQVGITSPNVVTHLDRALADVYSTDAHVFPYILIDPRGAPVKTLPRIRKVGLPFVQSKAYRVEINVLFADVDNPGHIPWTEETFALARDFDQRTLATAGVYYTTKGRRIVQPLRAPIQVDQEGACELYMCGWLRELMDLGYDVDKSCADWTRCFRLPHVKRDGKQERSRCVDVNRMRPIDTPAKGKHFRRKGYEHKPGERVVYSGSRDPLESPLGKAFEAMGWLGPRLGPDMVSAVCPWESSHTSGHRHDTSTALFGASDRSPIGRVFCFHSHCQDRSMYEVVAMLDPDVKARFIPDNIEPAAIQRPEPDSKDEAKRKLEEAIRKAPDGLSVVVAGCGAGKTEAAIKVATERAFSTRARRSKTAISVPDHRLAAEIAERARKQGTPVARVFGPTSAKNADGTPMCHYHGKASTLAAGGLSVTYLLCEGGKTRRRCRYYEDCTARLGVEEDEEAKLFVGPHQLLPELSRRAGKTGILVIDEPPQLLTHEPIPSADIMRAQLALDAFDDRFATIMRPALDAISAYMSAADEDKTFSLHDALSMAQGDAVSAACEEAQVETLLAAVREAVPEPVRFDDEGQRVAPPVPDPNAPTRVRRLPIKADVDTLMSHAEIKRISDASAVVSKLYRALVSRKDEIVARVEVRGDVKTLVLTMVEERLRDAMTREGATVIADANARLHLPIYQRTVNYMPPVTETHLADAVEVHRTWHRERATRTLWMPRGKLKASRKLLRSLARVGKWLDARKPARWVLVTFAQLHRAIGLVYGEPLPEGTPDDLREALEAAAEAIRPEVLRWATRPDMGHFGAIRGLDHWKGHDALVTMGDPFPLVTDVHWEATLLGLGDPGYRAELQAKAELEQAHGRLRTPHRTEPCSALHVGHVLPGGWESVEVHDCPDRGGRPVASPEDAPTLPRGGALDELLDSEGLEGAARSLGVSVGTLKRHIKAEVLSS